MVADVHFRNLDAWRLFSNVTETLEHCRSMSLKRKAPSKESSTDFEIPELTQEEEVDNAVDEDEEDEESDDADFHEDTMLFEGEEDDEEDFDSDELDDDL